MTADSPLLIDGNLTSDAIRFSDYEKVEESVLVQYEGDRIALRQIDLDWICSNIEWFQSMFPDGLVCA